MHRNRRAALWIFVLQIVFVLAIATGVMHAQDALPNGHARQSLSDAWWTGPLLANTAATLPPGHFLVEPYFYDVVSKNQNGWGSLAYVFYGLANRFSVGFIPVVSYNQVSNGLSSSHIGLGDLTPMAQFGLTRFHVGSWVPMTAIQIKQSFPTAQYDHLGERPSDGFGSGAYTTTLALNTQTYFWMPNGRILRMRFNVSEAFSARVNVRDVSVYGTAAGFRGHADPGRSLFVDAAWEYSLTRKWVPALDIIYHHDGNTAVSGYNMLDASNTQSATSVLLNSGSSDGFGFAPALEYNWKSSLGIIFGARVIAPGHNTSTTVAPVAAINFVH